MFHTYWSHPEGRSYQPRHWNGGRVKLRLPRARSPDSSGTRWPDPQPNFIRRSYRGAMLSDQNV